MLVGCAQSQKSSGNKTDRMGKGDRPEYQSLVRMASVSVEKQMNDEIEMERKVYLKEHTELPRAVRTGIQNNEVGKGMSRQEVTFAIGEPTKITLANNGNTEYFYESEGWLLRFDGKGWLYELVER